MFEKQKLHFQDSIQAGRDAYRDRQLDAYPWGQAVACIVGLLFLFLLHDVLHLRMWQAVAIMALAAICFGIFYDGLTRRSRKANPPESD